MSKLNRKKIKQVASRAKKNPRKLMVERESLGLADAVEATTSLPPATNDPLKTTVALGDLEFSTQPYEIARANALDRAHKVELKDSVKSLIARFRRDVDSRLKSLTGTIEEQMKPLIRSAAEVAVAKSEIELQLVNFNAELLAVLDLNDEPELMEIEDMFASKEHNEDIDRQMGLGNEADTFVPNYKTEDMVNTESLIDRELQAAEELADAIRNKSVN